MVQILALFLMACLFHCAIWYFCSSALQLTMIWKLSRKKGAICFRKGEPLAQGCTWEHPSRMRVTANFRNGNSQPERAPLLLHWEEFDPRKCKGNLYYNGSSHPAFLRFNDLVGRHHARDWLFHCWRSWFVSFFLLTIKVWLQLKEHKMCGCRLSHVPLSYQQMLPKLQVKEVFIWKNT